MDLVMAMGDIINLNLKGTKCKIQKDGKEKGTKKNVHLQRTVVVGCGPQHFYTWNKYKSVPFHV